MSKNRRLLWATLIVLVPALLVAFVLGLWAFMSATATPIHPNPKDVPSLTRSIPLPKWAGAVEQGRQIVRSGITEQNLPGLSVAVAVAGDIVWAEGFGWADLDYRTPVSPETKFRMGGASNALTSAAVGLLLEKRELKLDDEIQTYVPQFPKKQWPVTLRQLMGNQAGIRDDPGDEAPMDVCKRTLEGLKLDDFANRPLLFEPGTQYRRSSYGWILVSAAVEAAAGEPFFRFMHSEVFEPSGMGDTRVEVATESIPNRTTFYYPRFAGNTKYGPESVREGDHSCYAGGGAFLSTPSDLARFGIAISRGKLLQPATVEMLQTPQRLRSGEQTDYGLGWKIETVPLGGERARMAGHGTKTDFIGGTASLLTFPERGIVVAVMSNISFADTRSLGLSLAQVFARR